MTCSVFQMDMVIIVIDIQLTIIVGNLNLINSFSKIKNKNSCSKIFTNLKNFHFESGNKTSGFEFLYGFDGTFGEWREFVFILLLW